MKSGMKYIHLPLREEMVSQLDKHPHCIWSDVASLEISLNIDGLPLFNNSPLSLWPVLCAIHLKHDTIVFPTTLTLGESKPTDLDFLNDSITCINELLNNGLQYNKKKLNIYLRCIVCDAPARAMVKSIKQFSGYYGCEICTQRGQWLHKIPRD